MENSDKIRPVTLWILLLILGLFTGCNQENLNLSDQPNLSLTPKEVVVSQLKALKSNDKPNPDHGIIVAFAFASPTNKINTGPINRFKQMLKSPAYNPLINCKAYKVSKHFIDFNEAQFFVKIDNKDGTSNDYIFELSKQIDGEFEGYWMTEAVIPIKDKIKPQKDQPLKA